MTGDGERSQGTSHASGRDLAVPDGGPPIRPPTDQPRSDERDRPPFYAAPSGGEESDRRVRSAIEFRRVASDDGSWEQLWFLLWGPTTDNVSGQVFQCGELWSASVSDELE